jgi:chromosome segregation and condensation protein ScpB
VTRREIPARVGDRLGRVLAHVRQAEAKAEHARAGLGEALAVAQDDGYSVRQLAAVLEMQPTSVQRLIDRARAEA